MADSKIVELNEATSADPTDLLIIVTDVAGAGENKKITIENVLADVSGAVSSVNGVAPDEGGNVKVTSMRDSFDDVTTTQGVLRANVNSGVLQAARYDDPLPFGNMLMSSSVMTYPEYIELAVADNDSFRVVRLDLDGFTIDGNPIATEPYVASAVATLAPLASPTFTGTPAAPTAAGGTNTTQVATTAFVTSAVATGGVSSRDQSATTDTWVLTDNGKVIRCTNSGATVETIPLNSTVAFPLNAIVNVYAAGAGGTTVSGAGGVTIRNNTTALVQYQEASFRQDETDVWVRIG